MIAGFVAQATLDYDGVAVTVCHVLFNKGMLELKPMIPRVNPFTCDETSMQLDRNLHFGFILGCCCSPSWA